MIELFENLSEKLFEHGLPLFLGTSAAMVVAAGLLVKWMNKIIKKCRGEGNTLKVFFFNMLKAAIFCLAASGILMQITPLKNITVSLLAGTSIVALAISIASQEAVANLVGGIFISIYNPFSIGDVITLEGVTGTVEEVNMRHTIIRTFASDRIILPNSKVNSAVIQNYTINEDEVYTSLLVVSVAMEADVERAMAIMAEAAAAHPAFVDTRSDEQKAEGVPAAAVVCSALNPYSVDLRVTLRTVNRGASFGLLSDLRMEIRKRFLEEGILMPVQPQNIRITGDKI